MLDKYTLVASICIMVGMDQLSLLIRDGWGAVPIEPVSEEWPVLARIG